MANNAASEGALGALHNKVAVVLTKTLDTYDNLSDLTNERIQAAKDDPEMEVPDVKEVSAALLSAAIKFLKDNDITCQADESEAMSALERSLAARRAARGNVVKLRDVAVGED